MSVADVEAYLAKVPAIQRAALEHVRSVVKHVVPDAEEQISYGIPAFKYQGKYLFGYAAFKHHLSLFPAANPVAALEEKLADFKRSKGTIQFTEEHPVPDEIIKELVRQRLHDIADN